MTFKHPAITNYGMYLACRYIYLPVPEVARITQMNPGTIRKYYEKLSRRLGFTDRCNRVSLMRRLLADGFHFNLMHLESRKDPA